MTEIFLKLASLLCDSAQYIYVIYRLGGPYGEKL